MATTGLAAADLAEADVAFAHRLADLADSMSMPRFGAGDLTVERKADHSEVTEVDRAIEQAIRELVAAEREQESVVGEEFGGDRATAGARWIVDPIDGTRAYIRGDESWGTLIALQRGGVSVAAVASVPAMDRRYAAARGHGATMNGGRIHVSDVDSVDRALFAHTSISGFVRCGNDDAMRALAGRCWDARGMGNTLSHLAVARGSADIAWTSRACLWDYAALALIVAEAGGCFTDRSSDSPSGGPGVSSNGRLHQTVLDAAGIQA